MNDANGKALLVGQTVRERRGGRKTKVVSLDSPFVYINRDGDYDDAPVFPEDLTIVDTHEIAITLHIKCDTEEEAISKIREWTTAGAGSLPKETVSYEVLAK